jgi:hypothetical protein
MAVVLIATPAAVDANSYLTEVEADAYFNNRLYASVWTAATTDDKKRALIWATKLIDLAFEWTGAIHLLTQSLRWPRSGMLTIDGNFIENTVIPSLLKDAVAELGLALLKRDRSEEPEILGQGFSSASVSSVSVTVDSNQIIGLLPAYVVNFLLVWGEIRLPNSSSGRMVPLVRV